MPNADADIAAQPAPASRYCEACTRPRRVCVCEVMPAAPMALRGRVLVLQHPFEEKKQLGTVKLMQKCLAHCDVLVGRRFAAGKAPLLDAAVAEAAASRCPLYVLFPRPDSISLDEVSLPSIANEATARQLENASAERAQQPAMQPAYTLLIIDGTWKEAGEMMNRLAPRLLPPGGPGVPVRLPELGASACLLRKENREGDVMTMEAAAWALGALEQNSALAAELLAPLKRMTVLQAGWSPAIRARIAPVVEVAPRPQQSKRQKDDEGAQLQTAEHQGPNHESSVDQTF